MYPYYDTLHVIFCQGCAMKPVVIHVVKPALSGQGTGRSNSHPAFVCLITSSWSSSCFVSCLPSVGWPSQDSSWVSWRKQSAQTFIAHAVVSDAAIPIAAYWQMALSSSWHTLNLSRKSGFTYSPHGTRYNFCSCIKPTCLIHPMPWLMRCPRVSRFCILLVDLHPVCRETLISNQTTCYHLRKHAVSPCQLDGV